MSLTIEPKSAVASGWKTIAALPELRSSSVISSVTAAVDIANSRLSAGAFILRLPVRMSNRPISGRALQLHLQALERRDPLLHRRMRGEQAADRLADARREDVERLQLPGRAQVALRDPLHAAGDPRQRRSQRAGAARDQRGAAVGGELAVPRERL